MVPLNHGERTAGFQNHLQLLQRGKWLLKMLQNKANENVVKRMRRKGQTENIGQAKGHVRSPTLRAAGACRLNGYRRNID